MRQGPAAPDFNPQGTVFPAEDGKYPPLFIGGGYFCLRHKYKKDVCIKKDLRKTQVSYVGIYLFSRAASRQVSSAQASLTSVFGMGTGGPSPQLTPT